MAVMRDYDEALVLTKLGATVKAGSQPVKLEVAVTGLANPVYIGMGLPEDWYLALKYPGINVTRMAPRPAMYRMLPGFKGSEVSTNPATPNTLNIQKVPSQPVDIYYVIELAAESLKSMNAMTEWLALKLPMLGYGSFLSVYGHNIPYRSLSWQDLTNYETKEGRLYRTVATYVVEGWLISLECDKIGQILETQTETDVADPLP